MNFYQHVHDTHIFNQKIQINYITKYICFLYSYEQFKDENTLDYILQNQYLAPSLIDYIVVNTLCTNNIFLSLAD